MKYLKDKQKEQFDVVKIEEAHAYVAKLNTPTPIIKVAVIDYGVLTDEEGDAIHPDLKGKISECFQIYSGKNIIPYQSNRDATHATRVAGIISSNGIGLSGVLSNVKFISIDIQTLDSYEFGQKEPLQIVKERDIALKLLYAWSCGIKIKDNTYKINNKEILLPSPINEPASIMNCCIGIEDNHVNLLEILNTVCVYGRNGLGIINVFAAGNENVDLNGNDAKKVSKAAYFAATSDKVITVAAANSKNSRWSDSNYGYKFIDICAPGEDIPTTTLPFGLYPGCEEMYKIIKQTCNNSHEIVLDNVNDLYEGTTVIIENNKPSVITKILDNTIWLLDAVTCMRDDKMWYNQHYAQYSVTINVIPEKVLNGQFRFRVSQTDYSKLHIEQQYLIYKGDKCEKCTLLQKNKLPPKKESDWETIYTIVLSNWNTPFLTDINGLEEMRLQSLDGDYCLFTGTSASTPIVSGIASLILSVNNDLNWLEVRKILRDTANQKKLNVTEKDFYKFKNGVSQAYGYGMVDAFEAVKAAKNYIKYDLWIKRSEGDGDVGTDLEETVDLNVPDSNLNCSPHTINTKISNIGAANSIEGAEIRYLIRFSDLSNPAFEFPDAWMDNQIDSFLIGNSEIGVIKSGKTLEIKQEGVTQTIGEKKIEIEKVLRKCPADKHPYLLVHITPFDYGVTGNSVRTNNNLAYKRDVFLNAEFLQGDGTTRLPNSLPKSETPVPFKINVKMYNKAGAIDLNGMELKVKGFVKKNQEDKEERENKNTVFYAKYEGATFRTEIEQNNIVTDISTEVVDRNAQDKVTEVVISGNIHISELYKKLQITVTVSNCLNECTHEIRRKSAVFSKFTSALVEDMEFREKIYFFTDCDNLSNTKKYGAISSGDTDFQTGFDRYRITNVFAVEGTQETNTGTGTETTNETNSETSTPHKAYAVCKGKILVQEDKDDASLVNIVLKPEMHSSNNPAVKYFVYRGILKSSLYESDNSLKTNGNSVVSWIEKNIKEPDGRILGLELTNDARYGNEAPIDNAFYNSDGEFELLTVPAGWCIGTFADNYIGFEIWLDTIGFNPTFSMIRNHETIIDVEQLPTNPTDGDISAQKALKEQILNYMDPAAYFGNMYDDRIFVRNTNSEASRDGIEYSFEKVKKENLYTQIIDNFLNKNVVYIDIRNEFNTSYNYFGNYGEIKLDVIRDKEQQPTTEVCYEGSNWPIIATTFTPSFDDGVVKMAFKKGDNETPLAYVAIGERGRTLAEKIAQGKTNFVDLTAENGDYTDNSVAMVVPFRTNTAPNMENTYISVASYMRIDYLRRMKPTTPNNQEPQEQQELPQTPEITENLPVWKQRESSADLLFRPMDMKLPIENVTEGFVVKVYEDEVYIDVPEHEIDYMARMGIARDLENTYLFAVKSDLHTKNAFQMSNPRVSICSGFYKTGVSFLNYLTQNNLYKITINETGEFVLKIENKYAKDYLIAPDKETDFVIFAFSNQEYEKILQSIQSINNAQSSVYLSMKEIEKYEKASSYNLQLTYINADNQVKNSTIQIENNDNKLTMLG